MIVKKVYFLAAAMYCCVTAMLAVPAPTNVHWEGSILKWELPDLTGDSVYENLYLTLYSEAGDYLSGLGASIATEYDFSEDLYHGRTYYATVQTDANPGGVQSPEVTSPTYTVPGAKDTLEVPNVTLSIDGYVRWGDIGYMLVRATLQKKNGNEWVDVASQTTTFGWNRSESVGAITEPGTYRAIADGLQGNDVVRRGISEEIEVEEMFAVSFDAQSLYDNPDTTFVPKNAKIIIPDVADQYKNQRDGHVFYWSTDKEGDHPWNFEADTVTQDTTLYAQWKELTTTPSWDEDTCRWSVGEQYRNVFQHATIDIYSEQKKFIFNFSMSGYVDYFFMDLYFPGRNYIFSITLDDYYNNVIADTSAMHTVAGQAEVLPLELTVTDSIRGTVEWTAPKYGMFMRVGVLYHWNPSGNIWVSVATLQDERDHPEWYNYITFNYLLEDTQYYRIHCQLYQGEYLISEGVVYYGTNPSLAIDNVQGNDVQCTKVIRDGQLLIEKNGRLYNAQGVAVK